MVYIYPMQTSSAASRGGNAAKTTIGGILSVLVIVAFIGLKVCRVANKITGTTVTNEVMTIPPGSWKGGTFEFTGNGSYTLEVTGVDGPCRAGIMKIKTSGKVTDEEEVTLVKGSSEAKMGVPRKMSGSLKSGYYAWAVINTDEKIEVKAKVYFNAK